MDTFEDLPLLVDNLLVRRRGRPDDPLYRIVWTGKDSATTFLVRVDGAEDWIAHTATRALQARLAPDYADIDALELVDRAEDPFLASHRAEPTQRAAKRFALIKELVSGDNLYRVLAGIRTTALYEACGKEAGKSRQTIAQWVKLYLTRGLCADALDGDLHHCGGRGQRRNTTRKIGRPRSVTAGVGTQVDARGRGILNAGFFMYKAKNLSYKQVKEFIDLHYCRDWAVGARYTVGQVRYYIEQAESVVAREKRRQGARNFKLKSRPYHGKSRVYGPGAEYQIDATVADIYLVSALNRAQVVGRPTIYIVTDTFSRLIVGFYVGFENPSILGAALAMESVVTPKVELCRGYGLTLDEAHWPSHHLPARILHDRGSEFMSFLAWQRLKGRYGVDFDNAPPFRPDWKAIVESRFHLLKKEWGPYVPGLVERDYQERGGADYRLDAHLTLQEFTKVFVSGVVKYNNRPLEDIDHLPEFVAEGLPPSPVELWKFGVRHFSGLLRSEAIDAVRACVYPRATVRVTKEGIAFGTRFYETPRSVAEQWFSRARFDGSWTVDLACDPAAPERAYLIHDDGTFEHATLRATGAHYNESVSLAEILLLKQAATKNYANGVHDIADFQLDVQAFAEGVIATAKKKTADERKLAGVKVPSTKDIRAAREGDRDHERSKRAAAFVKPHAERPTGAQRVDPLDTAAWDDDGIAEDALTMIKRQRQTNDQGDV
ncbi:DDE-type integrase/transposase/recombinase [Cupriavidus necator]|uniref:transposase n=1 Tax=Cupriavidus necator TaxID=106590 RepID=UPI0039C42FEF